MDPISITELAALITQAAAGEAGKSAWDGLLKLTRRVFGRGRSAAIDRAKTGDRGAALDMAGVLVQSSAADSELAQVLRAWMVDAREAVSRGGVNNIISGRARIQGDVVQARDIGSVHFDHRRTAT